MIGYEAFSKIVVVIIMKHTLKPILTILLCLFKHI